AESVKAITMEDLKAYYNNYFSPSISNFQIVGKMNKKMALKDLKALEERWPAKEVTIPEYPASNTRNTASLYFVDIPNAKQSVINIGYISMPRTDADYYPAEVM